MQLIVTLIRRFLVPIMLVIAGVAGWAAFGRLFESSQSTVGPDFFARLPVKLVTLAFALLLTRLVLKFVFPTISKYTDTKGGHKASEFATDWNHGKSPHELVRLCLTIITYLGVLLVISQLLLSS